MAQMLVHVMPVGGQVDQIFMGGWGDLVFHPRKGLVGLCQ